MAKQRDWEALAEELRGLIGNATAATSVVVESEKDGIWIYPAESNCSGTFYHAEEVVDFCRCKKLSNWIGSYGEEKVRVHIF